MRPRVFVTGATGYIGGRLVPRLLAAGYPVRGGACSTGRRGGSGLRRGRRDPHRISFGEALDFWRVTGIEPNRRLALRAEMKLPGEALLEFTLEPLAPAPDGSPRTRLTQTARFLPRGLLGLAYWHLVLLLHGLVFRGMLDGIRAASEAQSAAAVRP